MDFIRIHDEQIREKYKLESLILYRTVEVFWKMFSGKQTDAMREYDFLYTEEEQNQAKLNRLYNSLTGADK